MQPLTQNNMSTTIPAGVVPKPSATFNVGRILENTPSSSSTSTPGSIPGSAILLKTSISSEFEAWKKENPNTCDLFQECLADLIADNNFIFAQEMDNQQTYLAFAFVTYWFCVRYGDHKEFLNNPQDIVRPEVLKSENEVFDYFSKIEMKIPLGMRTKKTQEWIVVEQEVGKFISDQILALSTKTGAMLQSLVQEYQAEHQARFARMIPKSRTALTITSTSVSNTSKGTLPIVSQAEEESKRRDEYLTRELNSSRSLSKSSTLHSANNVSIASKVVLPAQAEEELKRHEDASLARQLSSLSLSKSSQLHSANNVSNASKVVLPTQIEEDIKRHEDASLARQLSSLSLSKSSTLHSAAARAKGETLKPKQVNRAGLAELVLKINPTLEDQKEISDQALAIASISTKIARACIYCIRSRSIRDMALSELSESIKSPGFLRVKFEDITGLIWQLLTEFEQSLPSQLQTFLKLLAFPPAIIRDEFSSCEEILLDLQVYKELLDATIEKPINLPSIEECRTKILSSVSIQQFGQAQFYLKMLKFHRDVTLKPNVLKIFSECYQATLQQHALCLFTSACWSKNYGNMFAILGRIEPSNVKDDMMINLSSELYFESKEFSLELVNFIQDDQKRSEGFKNFQTLDSPNKDQYLSNLLVRMQHLSRDWSEICASLQNSFEGRPMISCWWIKVQQRFTDVRLS